MLSVWLHKRIRSPSPKPGEPYSSADSQGSLRDAWPLSASQKIKCANYPKRPFEPLQGGREMTCGVGLPGRGSGSAGAAVQRGHHQLDTSHDASQTHFFPKGRGSIATVDTNLLPELGL